MYSFEDRLRAVRLYIKLGRRVRLTIRQLGYATKNALKSWHREFEKHRDLPTGYVRRLGHDAPASMKRQQDSPPGSERAELEQQLEGPAERNPALGPRPGSKGRFAGFSPLCWRSRSTSDR
jgi:transposase-like protein